MGVANERQLFVERRRDASRPRIIAVPTRQGMCVLYQQLVATYIGVEDATQVDAGVRPTRSDAALSHIANGTRRLRGQCCVRMGIPIATATDGRQLSAQSSFYTSTLLYRHPYKTM